MIKRGVCGEGTVVQRSLINIYIRPRCFQL